MLSVLLCKFDRVNSAECSCVSLTGLIVLSVLLCKFDRVNSAECVVV